MNFTNTKIFISIVTAALIVAGCSVEPVVMTQDEIQKDALKSMETLNKAVMPVTKPITLDEAIYRAVNHNLLKKIEVLNAVLAYKKIDIISHEALPSLTAQAGYSHRDNYAASASASFEDGSPIRSSDPTYAVSQEKKSVTSGIGFSWNILDFGLSYVRAKQQADRYLIAKEKERKVIHNITQDVRASYYKAVIADELLVKIKPLMAKTRKAFEDSRNIQKLQLSNPMESLTYQRELLEVLRSLSILEKNLINSKTELSKLMGLKPGTKFRIAEKIKTDYKLPSVTLPIEELEVIALNNRPELQETRYQEKISHNEVRSTMLKMLPGINLNAGYNYDSNNYLLNNQWANYGASVSWNMLDVFNVKKNKEFAEAQVELAKAQKLALSMAVITQVHISILEYNQAIKEYDIAKEYFLVAQEIFNIIESENSLNVNGQLTLIKERLNYLLSSLRLSSSYAEVQNSYGKVIASTGKQDVFDDTLTQAIQEKEQPDIEVEAELEQEEKVTIAQEPQSIENSNTNEKEIVTLMKPQVKTDKEETPKNYKKVYTEDGYFYETPQGYVKIDDLGFTNTKSENTIHAIAKGDANIRIEPSLTSTIVAVKRKGKTVIALELINVDGRDWYRTSRGYISAKLLEVIKSN